MYCAVRARRWARDELATRAFDGGEFGGGGLVQDAEVIRDRVSGRELVFEAAGVNFGVGGKQRLESTVGVGADFSAHQVVSLAPVWGGGGANDEHGGLSRFGRAGARRRWAGEIAVGVAWGARQFSGRSLPRKGVLHRRALRPVEGRTAGRLRRFGGPVGGRAGCGGCWWGRMI